MLNQQAQKKNQNKNLTKSISDLQKENQWAWGSAQWKESEQIRSNLTHASVLALYGPNMETKVAADVSSFDDIGGVVLQLQPDDSWRPVSFISRAMTPTETRYAQIEKTPLRSHGHANDPGSTYIVGKSNSVETD